MKIRHLVYLPLMASAIISTSALAQDANTITFTGTLEEPTCSATVNGSSNGTVSLGKLDKIEFSKVLFANHTPFKITLTGCPTNRKPFAYFYAHENVRDANRLRNTYQPSNNAAKGIVLVITVNNAEGTISYIYDKFSTKSARNTSDPIVKPDKDGNAELTYRAVFHRTAKDLDALIPGEFTTMVNYVIHYD